MYEFSSKPSSLLARALCGPRIKTYISHIMGSSGQRLTTSSDMAREFKSFYETLYNLDSSLPPDSSSADTTTPQSYLASLDMPSLPITVREELEEPITIGELGVALANSKPKKEPGPDGLTPSYYKVFFETLA